MTACTKVLDGNNEYLVPFGIEILKVLDGNNEYLVPFGIEIL
jgi:hypothetical protein